MNTTQLIDAVNAGTYDAELGKLAEAVNKRLAVSRAMKTIADYEIGARVRFNEQTATRYMVGQYATIVSKNRTKIVVRPETPMGRFAKINPATGDTTAALVTVPIAIVDLV